MTMREGGTLPPSPGRRCPEGAEVGSRRGMKKWGGPFRIVIPSAVEGSLRRSGILHAGGHVKIAWDHWFHVILPSSFYRCARKISRLRSKWRGGETAFSMRGGMKGNGG